MIGLIAAAFLLAGISLLAFGLLEDAERRPTPRTATPAPQTPRRYPPPQHRTQPPQTLQLAAVAVGAPIHAELFADLLEAT